MRTIPALAAMAAITTASTSAASAPMDTTVSMNDGPPPRIHGEPTSEMMLAKVVRDSQRKHRSRNTHPGKR